ncbi:hypothetical protein BH09PSE3_BH09PSE3_00640 [soil metagenome]
MGEGKRRAGGRDLVAGVYKLAACRKPMASRYAGSADDDGLAANWNEHRVCSLLRLISAQRLQDAA